MTNFTEMTDTEIVEFLDCHIHEITDDPAEQFPENIYRGLKQRIVFILKSEFAVAVVVRRMPYADPEPLDTQLVFLYTIPSTRRSGAAGRLIDEIKARHLDGGGMTLRCSGDQRRRFFEGHGFVITDDDGDPYEMMYQPTAGR